MQIKKTITVVAATLVLTGSVVGGAAMASSRHGNTANAGPAKHSISQRLAAGSTTDSDTVEQGDQTGPETPDTTEASSSDAGGENGTGSGDESETGSDGQGGHEDPPGNVDHQFEGEE